jgi:hypothetical protein
MRHTARLTLNLRSSQESLSNNQSAKAFRQAVLPGVPALVGTFIVSLGIALFTPGKLSDEFLWLSLVVVWALTVPHMMVTARLDKAAARVVMASTIMITQPLTFKPSSDVPLSLQ